MSGQLSLFDSVEEIYKKNVCFKEKKEIKYTIKGVKLKEKNRFYTGYYELDKLRSTKGNKFYKSVDKKVKYVYNKQKTTFECPYCGFSTEGERQYDNWFLLVDDKWDIKETYCTKCVNSSVGAYWNKREHLSKVKPKYEAGINWKPRNTQLSFIKWNKFTRNTLKKLWIKNKTNDVRGTFQKPYYVNKNLQYFVESEYIEYKKGDKHE